MHRTTTKEDQKKRAEKLGHNGALNCWWGHRD
jgi:hypothetical protein